MNPRRLQRLRRELEPIDTELDNYALTPPTYENTTQEDEELPEVTLAPDEENIPSVSPSPDYEDPEDPITKYSDYGTEEYQKLSGMEPVALERRGPWHQILGGLAGMSPITAGLTPNLVYKNYDAYKNQETAFEQQKAKADLEAENRRTSMSAGTSAYNTRTTEARDRWNQTTGIEFEARKSGLAPRSQTPQSLMVPGVPPVMINGQEYVQLKDPNSVSFSYIMENADTGTNNLLVLHKDGTKTISDTGIKFVPRRDSSNLNSLMLDVATMEQALSSGELTPEQAAQVEKDLNTKKAAIESIKQYDQEKAVFDARTRAAHRALDDNTPQDSPGLREAIERARLENPNATDDEIRRIALTERAPRPDNKRPPGFPTAAESGVDASRVAANVTNIGEFKPGMWNFIPGLGGTTEDEAITNIKSANQMIVDLAEKTQESRGEDMSGFLPSIQASTPGLPKELQKRFKEYIKGYNENIGVLQQTGDDLWYHPTMGYVITPRDLVEDQENGINTLEQAIQALQGQKFQQYRFVTN